MGEWTEDAGTPTRRRGLRTAAPPFQAGRGALRAAPRHEAQALPRVARPGAPPEGSGRPAPPAPPRPSPARPRLSPAAPRAPAGLAPRPNGPRRAASGEEIANADGKAGQQRRRQGGI